MEIASLTIDEIREGLLARRFRAGELAAEALRFAEDENPKTGAYLHFSPERALSAARRVDEKIARGEDPGALAGVPVAVKDVIVTAAFAPPAARSCSNNYIPPYDATAIDPPGGGRRPDRRQDQLRRVRDGLLDREFGVRAGAQSGGAGPRSGRLERRFGGGRGAGHRGGVARFRYRRLDPPAGFLLRRRAASRPPTAAFRATA